MYPLGSKMKLVMDFLRKESIMVLSTSSKSGRPHSAAVFFLIEDDFSLVFLTKENTKKARQIKENRHVAVTVGLQPPMSVQIEGTVKPVTKRAEKLDLIARLAYVGAYKQDYWAPIVHISAGDYAVFRITPKWIRGLDLTVRVVTPEDPPYIEIRP